MSFREIGSEFWDVPVTNVNSGVFPNHICWCISGRGALLSIISDISCNKKISKVLLPSWCCESMIVPFITYGIKVDFYSVLLGDGCIRFEYPLNIDADAMLIMDYFGYSVPKNSVPNCDCVKIRDITHSVFSRQYNDSDYYFGSLRKWAGFYTGGFAYKHDGKLQTANNFNEHFVDLRKQAMSMKKDYIEGRTTSKAYLGIFAEAEELLDSEKGFFCADDIDIERAKCLDVNFIKYKRRENAKVLLSRLKEFALFSLHEEDCPMFVPIAVANRDEVRSELISESIYCPCHWGISGLHHLSNDERRIYDCELSLVCDQRYNTEDMNRICDIVERVAKAC